MKRKEILEGRYDPSWDPDYRPKRHREDPDAWKQDRDNKDDRSSFKRYEPSDAEKAAEKERQERKRQDLETAMRATGGDKWKGVFRSKDVEEGANDELKRYLIKDVYDKLDQLNKMYTKAKQLGDAELMGKVKVAMAKVAAKKSKLASDLGISEAELDEMNAPGGTPQPAKVQKVNPDGTAEIVDTKGTVTKVNQKDITPGSDGKLNVNVPKPKLAPGTDVTMTSEETEVLKKLAGL